MNRCEGKAMLKDRGNGARLLGVATAMILAQVIFAGAAFAKKQPKTYPETGKVTATAVNQVPFTTYQHAGGPNGGSTVPVHGVRISRTYTIDTETKTYELDCGKHPRMFSSTPGECGGDKKIEIGDTIQFRLEKGWAYLPVPVTVEPSGEQKLRVLNEELKQDPKPAAQPGTPDAKPPGQNL
jgi:hypothetical protein